MTLYPIEVKKTANPNIEDRRSFKTLSVFKKKIGTGAIVCLYEKTISLPNTKILSPYLFGKYKKAPNLKYSFFLKIHTRQCLGFHRFG
jgi:hypothetical protein